MSFLDVMMDGVNHSGKLSPESKAVVTRFIQENRDLLERLGEEATQEFFQMLYLHGSAGAWETLAAHLDQGQLLELLRQTGQEMDNLASRRAAALAEWDRFIAQAGEAALKLLTRLALALL